MVARRIDGRAHAKRIEDGLAKTVHEETARRRATPHLAAVLVGDDPASAVYVKRKSEAAARVGIRASTHRLPATASREEVRGLLARLAEDGDVDGILLQLPLPPGLDEKPLLSLIPPEKDVDCFHPTNVGAVALDRATLLPCTPAGILELLTGEGVKLEGAETVIVNHSHVVGRPLAELLLSRNATVTVCHKFTRDLASHTRRADVLVSATGVAGLITREHVKPGAVVIDVGIARNPQGGLTGDVRFEEVAAIAGAITPVPGGVGPMTVAMLMRNVVAAWRSRRS